VDLQPLGDRHVLLCIVTQQGSDTAAIASKAFYTILCSFTSGDNATALAEFALSECSCLLWITKLAVKVYTSIRLVHLVIHSYCIVQILLYFVLVDNCYKCKKTTAVIFPYLGKPPMDRFGPNAAWWVMSMA